jgi:hypothetical protein
MTAAAAPVPRDEGSRLLDQLRQLMPRRQTPLSADEALQIAERQAGRLRVQLGFANRPALPAQVIAGLPFVRVAREPALPTPGLLLGTELGWVIALNAEDYATRQAFSLLHEFKHLLDDPFTPRASIEHDRLAERVCNHFAACALMPRVLLKRDWGNGRQDVRALATRYGVSVEAMGIRLRTIGLAIQLPRGERPDLSTDELQRLSRRLARAWHPTATTSLRSVGGLR